MCVLCVCVCVCVCLRVCGERTWVTQTSVIHQLSRYCNVVNDNL